MGLSVGKKTQELNNEVIMNSRTILWNGPLGVFEFSNFAEGTIKLGDSIAEATKRGAFSLVGGGDSVAFVKQFGPMKTRFLMYPQAEERCWKTLEKV